MPTFEELYRGLLMASAQNQTKEDLARLAAANFDRHQMDCLLHPENHPAVRRSADCASAAGQVASRDVAAVVEALCGRKGLAYALVAPAFIGQFGAEVTPGRLRTAFKRAGFGGMIRKVYAGLLPRVPPSVSPMIAGGRTIKRLYPKAMLDELMSGKVEANFFEGMGCAGGCVGGPRAILDREAARANVDGYGEGAIYPTPIENPYVVELLRRLGFDTPEQLVEHSDIFTRTFPPPAMPKPA